MKKKVSLFIFIDALGWEVLQAHPFFLSKRIQHKKPLKTILGYSSACDPSIISGLTPSQHGLWSSFYYSPETCPYAWTRWLRWMPSLFMDYHRTRYYLSQTIKKIHKFTGYFQIYNVPFKYLTYFDYAEKYNIWHGGGLPQGKTIFDHLLKHQIPHYIDDSAKSDGEKITDLTEMLKDGNISFAYLLLGRLDAVMHAKGTKDPEVTKLMQWYDEQLNHMIATAEQEYEEVNFYVFTDHGMHNVQGSYDLQKDIKELGFVFGTDYVAMYDSTMARFWFLNDSARKSITTHLNSLEEGRILKNEELEKLGVYFPDHQYGECVFLMNSNLLIVPSFMGKKSIPGMHGYHPDDPDSYASLSSNCPLPDETTSIEHIFHIMMQEAGLEKTELQTPKRLKVL